MKVLRVQETLMNSNEVYIYITFTLEVPYVWN